MKNNPISFILVFLMSLFIAVPVYAERPPDDGGFREFQLPEVCFMTFFSPASTPVGQPSCGKKIVRFKLDEINRNLQQAAIIIDAAKAAAKAAGHDMFENIEVDLTEKMQVEADRERVRNAARFAEQNINFTVTKAILTRGTDQTIEGALYQVWKFHGAMTTTAGSQTFSDVLSIEIALSVGDPNTTRILEQTMSFGGGSNSIQGIIISNTATGSTVSMNLNFEMSTSGGGAFDCTDPNNPDTCTNQFDHSFEQTVALAQSFDSEGKDSGKIQWTESGEGGGSLPLSPNELLGGGAGGLDNFVEQGGPPPGGAKFNNTMSGGWDTTGAGCLEMEQDVDAVFRADSSRSGTGGAFCGPFVDGSEKCENYKHGRKYAAILKVEAPNNSMFGACNPLTGECAAVGPPMGMDEIMNQPPEFRERLQENPGQGFSCGEVELTNNCDGHCPDGVPSEPPDPTNAANNTEVQAWLMGCFEGLLFNDTGMSAGFGGQSRKGESWDAAGLVATTSSDYSFTDRDARIDKKFDRTDNFDNDRAVNFEKTAGLCKFKFDDTKNVEIYDDGSGREHCVPDFFRNNNSAAAGTPLCSAAGAPSC